MAATSKDANKAEIYQFKITLKGTKPPIWRRVQVSKECSFLDLHMAIQDAMGWKDYHLHAFLITNSVTKRKTEIGVPCEDQDVISSKTVKIGSYFLYPKDKAMYEYDFGDGWEHTITLEKILPIAEGMQYPQCIDGKRACPPEDCGGVSGYEENLEIMSNPKHKEYLETKEWLERMGWLGDAEAFDPKSIKFRNPKESSQ